MIRTRKQAMTFARAQTRNNPGTCQLNVRTWFNAPSAGDQDGDGDADAVDGWLSEPQWARHAGDRNPPEGVPLAFHGGSRGFGHRALAMRNGVQSTDMAGNRFLAGATSLVTGTTVSSAIAQIERSMNVSYTGWSETIDGFKIPVDKAEPVLLPPKPPVGTTSKLIFKVSKKAWRGFVHLKARFYMDYRRAVVVAGHRKKGKAVDIDTQKDSQNVLWALHWKTVGKNKLHDPHGKIRAGEKIETLTTAEVERLRGPKGQKPNKLLPLLRLAFRLGVRVEVELKTQVSFQKIRRILSRKNISAMNRRGDLQFKTLAELPGSLNRLAPVQRAGGTTILSFTGYTGKGLDKTRAFAVADYVRGKPHWR